MTTTEGNRLIAEFMGIKCKINTRGYLVSIPVMGDELDYLSYHLSWNLLMPVVEKIESLGYYTNIFSCDHNRNRHAIHITPLHEREQYTLFQDSKIYAVWVGVVQFIQKYNQNKQP